MEWYCLDKYVTMDNNVINAWKLIVATLEKSIEKGGFSLTEATNVGLAVNTVAGKIMQAESPKNAENGDKE